VTTARGGAISQPDATGSVVLDRSTIDSNRLSAVAIGPSAAGGGVDTAAPLSVMRSTINGNRADAFPVRPQLLRVGVVGRPQPDGAHGRVQLQLAFLGQDERHDPQARDPRRQWGPDEDDRSALGEPRYRRDPRSEL
jgi:hypothetical protein